MHIFKLTTLFYLSLPLIGLAFCLISMIGIPGNIKNESYTMKFLMNIMGIFMNLAWFGTAPLFIASIVLFYLRNDFWGKICSVSGLSFGLGTFLSLIMIYYLSSKNK